MPAKWPCNSRVWEKGWPSKWLAEELEDYQMWLQGFFFFSRWSLRRLNLQIHRDSFQPLYRPRCPSQTSRINTRIAAADTKSVLQLSKKELCCAAALSSAQFAHTCRKRFQPLRGPRGPSRTFADLRRPHGPSWTPWTVADFADLRGPSRTSRTFESQDPGKEGLVKIVKSR